VLQRWPLDIWKFDAEAKRAEGAADARKPAGLLLPPQIHSPK
jgi:hypothetical protein